MKIAAPSFLNFEPRRLKSEGAVEDQHQQLLLENPALPRSLEGANIGHQLMGTWNHFQDGPLGRLVAGGVAVGAGIWGTNKLLRGQTALDRVEGVGLLAMATGKAVSAGGNHHPTLAKGAGLVQCGADLVLGMADTVRGVRENNRRRLTVGLAQMAIGASIGATALVPSVAGASTAVWCAAVVTRQLALGFHTSLPDK